MYNVYLIQCIAMCIDPEVNPETSQACRCGAPMVYKDLDVVCSVGCDAMTGNQLADLFCEE